MPRIARKNLSGNYFHVMVQGLNKEHIFSTDKNKNMYKQIILKYYKDFDICQLNILSYCIMSNHTHFLVYCKNFILLSLFMHKINSAYSQYYNKSSSRVGYVFRDRFRVQEIKDINHLYNCLKYIHNNPVKADICHSMHEYVHSSYNEFLGEKNIINDESIRLLFGNAQNFTNVYRNIHNSFNNENFLEMHDIDIGNFANVFLKKNQLTFHDIVTNNLILRKFVKQAKQETDATLKDIAKFLGISVGKVGYHFRK